MARGITVVLSESGVNATVANAINFLKGTREPHALLFMNIIHRRFGIEEFADTLKRYDEVLTENPQQAPVLRVMRRIADANNPIEPTDWEHVKIATDRLLVSALYCDRLGLPESFAEALDRAIHQGGYAATHALLAWVWVQENGCELNAPEGFVEKMCITVAAMIDADPTSINDIKLEAGAFLCLARQSAKVNLGFVQRVIAIQNSDGGWGAPDESNWHSTILALIIVLHIQIV